MRYMDTGEAGQGPCRFGEAHRWGVRVGGGKSVPGSVSCAGEERSMTVCVAGILATTGLVQRWPEIRWSIYHWSECLNEWRGMLWRRFCP